MNCDDRRCEQCIDDLTAVFRKLRRKEAPEPLISELRLHFASPSGILESSIYALRRCGLLESEAQLIKLIPELARYTMREQYGEHPKLNTLSIARDYLKTLYIGVPIEQFNVLYLDDSGRLIVCKTLQKGTFDETPFYLEHLLQDVVFTDASAIVLSHNHPGGTKRPSRADIQCTLSAMTALYPLNVMLLDHIIIANDCAVSLRDNVYIDNALWLQQNPDSPLLRKWLDTTP